MNKFLSKKFINSLIITIVLIVILIILIRNDLLTDMKFGMWLGGFLANFGIYSIGNVASKKYGPQNNHLKNGAP